MVYVEEQHARARDEQRQALLMTWVGANLAQAAEMPSFAKLCAQMEGRELTEDEHAAETRVEADAMLAKLKRQSGGVRGV